MAIPFKQIPANLLVPGQYQEIDNSLAGSVSDIKKALLIGYKTNAGSADAEIPFRVLSAAKAAELCGHGSDAALMVETFLAINKTEELWILPIAEPQAGAKWSASFDVSGNAAANGRIVIALNGKIFFAPVKQNDTASQIAASVAAAVNGDLSLPVEAAANDETITLTALTNGTSGNDNTVSIISDAQGTDIVDGDVTPGIGSVPLAPVFASLGDTRYNYIVSSFSDEESLAALSSELESRYGALRQIGGRAFAALSGDLETLLTQAQNVNSPHVVLVPRGNACELPCVWAASWCAASCRILADDPAANTYDTKAAGLTGASYSFDERQKMLEAGIATYRLDSAGNVLIERLVTGYTENSDGGRDTSYLDVQVTETVDAVRTYINAEAKKRFKTWKLAGTEENFGSGAKVMTAGVWRSFLAELYQEVFVKEKQWCQDFDGYRKSIAVEIKQDSKTRLEYSHEPNLIGQFYIGAGLIQFK